MITSIRLLMTACLLLSVATSCAEKSVFTRSNTAIAFDIDDVILERSYSIPALLWKHKVELLKSILDFSLIRDLFYLFRKTAPLGAYIVLLEKRHSRLVGLARDLALTRTLNPKTACIIETLLDLGYELHIGTNEVWNEFHLHSERFPLLQRFSTYTFADYSQFPAFTQKPDRSYFEHLRARILDHAPQTQHLIFIDDRARNVNSARKLGFIGIVFTTAEALEQELVAMNIMPLKCTVSPVLPVVR